MHDLQMERMVKMKDQQIILDKERLQKEQEERAKKHAGILQKIKEKEQ